MAKTKPTNIKYYESKQHPGVLIKVDLDSFNSKTKTYFADTFDGKSISINNITLTRWWIPVEESVFTESVNKVNEVNNPANDESNNDTVTESDVPVKTEQSDVPVKAKRVSRKTYAFTVDDIHGMLSEVFGRENVARINGHCGCTVKNDLGVIMYEFYVRKFDGTVRVYTREKFFNVLNLSDDSIQWVVNPKFNLTHQFTTSSDKITTEFLSKFKIEV